MTQHVTQIEFARLEGIAKSYVTQLKQAGRLVMQDDLVDVEASRALIAQTADPAKDAVAANWQAQREESKAEKTAAADTNQTEEIGSNYQAARAVKEKYNAMQAKLDYERAVGEVVARDAVVYRTNDAATTFRVQMERLPDILAPQLAAESNEREIRLILADAIESALEELSSKLRAIEHNP